MSKDLASPNLFNPMMLWADLSMRALEATLSSSHTISDGVDRMAHASANSKARADSDETRSAAALPGLELVAQMQRTTINLMTQGWQQWMNTLGALMSFSGRSLGETGARQNPVLNAMRESIQSGQEVQKAITRAASSSLQQAGRQRERHADATERAHAAAEPKRRSSGGRAKPKARSRNS